MTEISLKKSTAIHLIQFKLIVLRTEIEGILERWKEELAQTFLKKARDGTYLEAENDAIDLRQLLKEELEMQSLLQEVGAPEE